MKTLVNEKHYSQIIDENELLREEVRVARRASEITAKLVVEQFVKTEKILQRLEGTAATEKELRQKLAEKLGEAEVREKELARERKRLEEMQIAAINMMEDMARTQRAAEIANRAKSEFLANMSHEIRTPMNAILGFAEILRNEIKSPKYNQYLETIASSGETLLSLINDILDLSKIEAGRLELQNEALDLGLIFTEIKRIFSQRIEAKGIQFQVEIESALTRTGVVLDEIRLRQILFNLVGNAVKFTHAGRIGLRAFRRPQKEPGKAFDLVFQVSDSGIGIPEDQRRSIFKAFRQKKGQSTRRYGGTGLGLAITKRLVGIMNGDILLRSRVGEGTVFQVVLKDVQPADMSAVASRSTLVESATRAFAPATILIVDDIESNRSLLKGYLEAFDFTFIEAGNGRAAVAMARKHRPDLILMDMKLPEMDGFQATRVLKQDSDLRTCPVVAITAAVMRTDEDRIRSAGCDGFLTKPISKSDLIAELQRFLTTISQEKPPAADQPRGSGDGAEAPIAPRNANDLKEMLTVLTSDFVDQWKRINNTYVFKEVEAFAEKIKLFGERYGSLRFSQWGDTILSHAKNFDMENLPGILAGFPEMHQALEQLRKE